MTKKLILLLATCLLVTSCLFGCGDDPKPSDDNPTTTEKVETTTKEDVATTEPTTAEPTTPPETTTQEPTTEKPTTEYVYKGVKFAISSEYQSIFANITVEKGHKFNVNDFVAKDASDVVRGKFALDLVKAIFSKNNDKILAFNDKYFEAGTTVLEISYSQNVVIEYDGDEKLCFYLVKDNGKYSYFDVYAID